MQRIRSIAARLNQHDLCVAGGNGRRSLFTAAPSIASAEVMGLLGFSHYSTSLESSDVIKSSPVGPKGCLMYLGGFCALPGHDVERASSYLEAYPLLQKASRIGLIHPRKGKAYIAGDEARSFVWNAIFLPHLLHANRIPTKGLFDDDNVVMIKRLGVLAFKDISPAEKDPISEHVMGEGILGALSWAKKMVLESLGIELEDLPLEFQKLFGYMSESPLDIEKILTDVSLLSREARATLIMRIYGVLKKLIAHAVVNSKLTFRENDSVDHKVEAALRRYPVTHPDALNIHKVRRIVGGLPYTRDVPQDGPYWTTTVNTPDSFLKPFVGKMGGRKALRQGPIPDGNGILHLHRNGVSHWGDEDIVRLILKVAARDGISIPEHCLGDVVDLLSYEFPEFLQFAVALFRAEGLLPLLDLWSLFTGPRCLPI